MGLIKRFSVTIPRHDLYHTEIEAFIESNENGKFDFSLFGDNVSTPMDGNSATKRQIRNLGAAANCSFSDAAAI